MHFETRSVTEWESRIGRPHAPVRVLSPSAGFRASLTMIRLGGDLTIAELRSTPMRLSQRVNPARDAVHDSRAMLAITLGTSGSIIQDEFRVDCQDGDGLLGALNGHLEFDYPAGLRLLIFSVDRDSLERRCGIGISAPLLASASAPSVRVAACLGRELLAMDQTLPPLDRLRLAGIVSEALSAVISSAVSHAAPALTGRLALLSKLREDVMTRLGDPELSPANLATRHHLSVRYVHALFTESGISCAAFIRQQRLNATHQLLASPAYAGIPISTVASRLGFNDSTSFIRAFRRQFGASPSAFRARSKLPEAC